ncbi:MAG TPA: universal stress protein [Polyangiaceae bacterium]
MIRSILACLDDSARAPAVFDMAAEVAERFGAKLHPLRVVTLPESSLAAPVSHGDTRPETLAANAVEELARMALRAPRVQTEPPMVRDGVAPWRQILESSDELDVDLIVLGSHGHRGVYYLLGNTAMRVVNLARRPVLVVHARVDGPAP